MAIAVIALFMRETYPKAGGDSTYARECQLISALSARSGHWRLASAARQQES